MWMCYAEAGHQAVRGAKEEPRIHSMIRKCRKKKEKKKNFKTPAFWKRTANRQKHIFRL